MKNISGVLIIDPQLVTKQVREVKHTFCIPVTQIAVDLGNRMAANMVMLGFVCECFGTIKKDDLISVVKEHVPARFVELNVRAVEAGVAYARDNGMYYR